MKTQGSIERHITQDRNLEPSRYNGVFFNEVEGNATFLLWNFSTELVGYQRYNPSGEKNTTDKYKMKYLTRVTGKKEFQKIGAWGLETVTLNPNEPLFLTEGIFDACKLHNLGFEAIAVLANHPIALRNWLFTLNKVTVAVCDGDKAGLALAKVANYSTRLPVDSDVGSLDAKRLSRLKEYFVTLKWVSMSDIKMYKVGGAVRDGLLNVPSSDQDWVVVGANHDAMVAKGFVQVGKDFPVYLHPWTKEEYALARLEKKTSSGHTGFDCVTSGVTLDEDLSRRDLTINAMAIDESDKLFDPYGGQKDLEAKILRHVSDAFADDPLRVFRVARFAARFSDFTIAPETMDLMRTISESGELNDLSAERIWGETFKALQTEHAVYYFEVLNECGALKVIFPELHALIGQTQPEKYHPEGDAWVHTLLVLNNVRFEKPEIQWAALIHDIGKGLTPKDKLPSHHGHEGSGAILAESMCKRLKVPNTFTYLAIKVCEYHLQLHRLLELKPKTVLKLLKNFKATPLTDFAIVCKADAQGKGTLRDYPQADIILELQKALQARLKDEDVTLLVEDGVSGAKIGEHLHKLSLHVVREVLAPYKSNDST